MCWGLLHILLTTRTRWHHHPPLLWSTARAFAGQDGEDPFHSLTEICHQASRLQWGQGAGNGTWGQSSVPTCQLNWKLTLPLRKKIPVP